jgi:hypothetical protein
MTGLEILGLAGTALSAVGTVAGGVAAKNQAEAQAQAAERQANEVQAASQREAIQRSREAKLLISRQTALAAASGGGAADPSILTNAGNIAARGKFNADSALYEGSAAAAGLQDTAAVSRWQGRQEMFGSFIKAGSTTLNGLSAWQKNRAVNPFQPTPDFWPA